MPAALAVRDTARPQSVPNGRAAEREALHTGSSAAYGIIARPRGYALGDRGKAVSDGEQEELAARVAALERELERARERERASAEILRTISTHATGLDAALERIAVAAQELFQADHAAISVWDGNEVKVWDAVAGSIRRQSDTYEAGLTFGRAAYERGTPVIVAGPIEDWEADYPGAAEVNRRAGWTELSASAVPLMAPDGPIGSLLLIRPGAEAFTDEEVGLLEGFASQAVVALENARLIGELDERNEDLAATADVLRIVSEYSTDLETVLDRVIERVCKLVDADRGFTFLVEGNRRRGSGIYDPNPQESRFNIAEGRELDLTVPVDTAILERRPVHVWGTRDEIREQFPNAGGVATEVSTRLCVPILQGEQAIGGIVLSRSRIAPYSEREIALVQSFADQAAIAIGNSRLLGELEESNRSRRRRWRRRRTCSGLSASTRRTWTGCWIGSSNASASWWMPIVGLRSWSRATGGGSGAYVPTGENPFRVAEDKSLT